MSHSLVEDHHFGRWTRDPIGVFTLLFEIEHVSLTLQDLKCVENV